jgi:MerR family transcriptional regulator, mercuric resistance operon regulatory protein
MDIVPWYGTYPTSRPRDTMAEGKGFMQSGFTIGRLAKAAGMNVETIRYYQRRGLIEEPKKPLGGHRRYPPTAVRQLAFIRRAQQLGFSLEEVKGLLAFADGGHQAQTRAMAEKKLAVISARAAELDKVKRELARLIEASRRSRSSRDPIVDALYAEAGRD